MERDDLERLHPEPHPLVRELERRARTDGVPVVSRQTGRLLSTLVACMQANRILEIGTGYGCATLWMALAQPQMGKIWTIEPDAARTDVARTYFERAGEEDNIEIFNTPATELLENFPHRNLDIVFVDAPVQARRTYLELAAPMLKLSGLVVVDDVLAGAGAPEFVEAFLRDPTLDATVLPLGDGIGIAARTR
jgi:caffeoyl-CoA O-methyltransferase